MWALLKFFKCPQQVVENSRFLLSSFAKHFQPLILTLGHPHPYPTGFVGSTSKVALEFRSISFPVTLPLTFLPGPCFQPGHLYSLSAVLSRVLLNLLTFQCFLIEIWNQITKTPFQGLGGPVISLTVSPLHFHLIPCAPSPALHPHSGSVPRLLPSPQDFV